jgi:hypothetical protein
MRFSLIILQKWVGAKVRAGVLQLTLAIGVIISIMCASMIMLVYYGKMLYLHQSLEDKLRNNAISGIYYGMATRDILPFYAPRELDLYNEEADSIMIVRKPWGLFEVVYSKAFQGAHSQTKTAIIAPMASEEGSSVIYTPDYNSAIYLVGDARIEGTVYASERKFSTGFINGVDFKGKRLLHGDAKVSKSEILSLDTTLVDRIKSFTKHASGDHTVNTLDRYPVQGIYSFEPPFANHYYSPQSIDLADSLAGNIIIESGIKVRVTPGAKLSDVILIAPAIEIDNEFIGSIQCFATRYIAVGNDCRLRYPSSLTLMGREQDSIIVVGRNTIVEGVVMIPGYDKMIGSKGVLKIRKKGLLHGSAYVNGQTDVQGSLWGHLMTRSFVAYDGETPYINHILNGDFSSVKRSPFMPGCFLWGSTNECVVAKWIE